MIDPTETTLGEVLRRTASRTPDKLALVSAERALSWAELDAEVDRVASLWVDVGIGRGDVVASCTNKRIEVVVNFLALARIGAIVAPINHKLETRRIADQLEVANVRGLLLEGVHDDVVDGLLGAIGPRIVTIAASRHRGRPYGDHASLPRASLRGPTAADPVYYNYTSGTTGRPKAAIHTHAQVLWNARSGVEQLGFQPDDVFLGMFSVFAHPHELFHRALLTGSTCVILDTMSPRVVCEAIAAHRVTWMMAVPSFYEMMLEHGGGGLDLSSLIMLESGGAWVSPDTLGRLEAHFRCHFMPVWGSTETCGVALAMPPSGPRSAGATGRPVPPYEVIVVDDYDRPVPNGSTGEMWVRGPAVARAYVGMPEASARAFTNGWYRTGDLVRVEPDGLFWFVGRRNDMLKVGGIRVFPLEIEQVLAGHPAIAEAVVVRAEERVRGEIPRAIIRLIPGSTLSTQEIRAWCRAALAIYKVPRIVEIWDDVPRLPNGKVDRQAIAATPPRATQDE